jgi:hypothetical protein
MHQAVDFPVLYSYCVVEVEKILQKKTAGAL